VDEEEEENHDVHFKRKRKLPLQALLLERRRRLAGHLVGIVKSSRLKRLKHRRFMSLLLLSE